jgi:hypothetical protein
VHLAICEDLLHHFSRTILQTAFGHAAIVVELGERVLCRFGLGICGLDHKTWNEEGESNLSNDLPIRHVRMLYAPTGVVAAKSPSRSKCSEQGY